MADKAMLTLRGRQRDESGEETVTKLRTQADYSIKNGSHYILYEEKLPDSENIVKNLIKLKGSVLEMTKRGPISSRMVFEAGKNHRTDYVTPYGILPLEVSTQELEVSTRELECELREPKDGPRERGLEIRLSYQLTSEGQFLSHCTIAISLSFLRGMD